jgi:SAM-dependent methyltransferase
MFSHYSWVTGTSETARTHCRKIATEIVERVWNKSPRIMEIGSNDGTLLNELVNAGAIEAIGIDPAANLIPSGDPNLTKVIQGFFSKDMADSIKSTVGEVDVIVARNVLSHVPDLNDVMEGISKLIQEDGIVVIEFHEASRILTELHYESIYHEHTFYHSIKSLEFALSLIGFSIFEVLPSPISGGSFVIFASKENRPKLPSLTTALLKEEASQVYSQRAWENFALEAMENVKTLRNIFDNERESKWIAFGASARSSTLLNTVGSATKNLNWIVDNNPLKQGKFSPGIHLEIVSPEKIKKEVSEKIFICAFNFEREIIELLRSYLDWHGEVIFPLPNKIRRFEI